MKYLAFLPGYAVPPLVALGFVYAFTRLLTPAEYGTYAVILSLAQLAIALVFSWLQLSVKRFYAEAVAQHWLGRMTLAIYFGYIVSAVLVIAAFLVFLTVSNLPHGHLLAYVCGVGLVLARAASVIVKAYRVGGLAGWRYSAMEAAESLVGFATAFVLVVIFKWHTAGLVLGLAVGGLMSIIIDLRALVARLRGARWDAAVVRQLLRFGAPFTASYALEYVMSSSDRLLIQYYRGADAVGPYAVAYTLADRGVGIAFQALAMVTYPLLMQALARGGRDAARQQASQNFTLLMALGLPAFAGFVVASPHIAAVMVGAAFVPAAQAMMPWIAIGVLLANVRLHYVNHAFHVAERTDLALACAVLPALLNVALNVALIPRIGANGAVISTVAAYALAIAIESIVSRRLFAMPVPMLALAKTLAATTVMAVALHVATFPPNTFGLAAMIGIGASVYGVAAVTLDVASVRTRILERLTPRLKPR